MIIHLEVRPNGFSLKNMHAFGFYFCVVVKWAAGQHHVLFTGADVNNRPIAQYGHMTMD